MSRNPLEKGGTMPLRDLIRSVAAEVLDTDPDDLTDATPITTEAIGSAAEDALYDRLTEHLRIGPLDVAVLDSPTLGELIQSAGDLVPVYFAPGDKAESVRVACRAFRWHPRAYAPEDGRRDLRAVFEDGPWKWDAQGRFAGAGVNPGHYFGLTADAATAEVRYYANLTTVPGDYVLLTLEIALQNVLDLTPKDTMVRHVRQCLTGADQLDPAEIAALLIEKGRGGNALTDYLGYLAHRDGYDGMLFFGARAIPETQRWAVENARPYDEALNNDYDSVRRLSRVRDNFNLVVFSGARVVGATSAFRCGGRRRWIFRRRKGTWTRNPLSGHSRQQILAASAEFGEEYQARRQRGFYRSKPSLQDV